MSNLYNRINDLCKSRGINITTMSREAGVSRASLTDLKMGRKQTLAAETLAKIASYFDVTIEYLLEGGQKQKKPLVNGDEELTAYLEELRTRPEMRMLFSVSKGATKEDVEKAVAIIEALRKAEGKA